MKKLLFILAIGAGLLITSCTKEGPIGKTGPAGANGTNGTNGANGKDGTNGINGTNGTNGVDANATCTTCHAKDVVDLVSVQYELSKHSYGETAFSEAGNTGCTPCHCSEAFKYVCANNIPSTFTLNAATGKYVNDYATVPDKAYGDITCSTCHSSLHSTYTVADLQPFTNVAPVAMTMWGGTKTINLAQKDGQSNLCLKCHQPRPFTASAGDGNVLDYAAIAANPTAVFYDTTAGVTTNKLKPGYRTHTHYGTVGAIVAGMGGIEFAGTASYASSAHATQATCQDCHMGAINGKAGGHSFSAAGNFNGCNATGCHSGISSSDVLWTGTRTEIKTLLNTLAGKLQESGRDILNRNPDATTNLWAGLTANNYDGYLNVYDPASNPTGPANNPNGLFQNPSPASSWTPAQKAQNLTYPKLYLTNAQMGAIINFQLCLREFSLGIHNHDYSFGLLTNSIALFP
ncbi:MAG: collagen-like protein [Bacteroidetes bacterium]|nr:collagen-like protein [Bacteroidota bacterium]